MQNSGKEARPPTGRRVGAGKKNMRGAKARLPRSSPTDVNCTAPPQAFHFKSCYQVLGARGQWGCTRSQARAHFCAHPQASVAVPKAIRVCTRAQAVHTYVPRQVHGGACLQIPAQSCTRLQARAPRLGRCQRKGKLGRTRTYLSAAVPRALRCRSAPWCSSLASLLVLPLPLSLSHSP